MTEEEAKTKWCPQYRNTIAGGTGGSPDFRTADNRRDHSDARCIGSACMAFRWLDNPEATEDEPYEGFCGLAGVPHA